MAPTSRARKPLVFLTELLGNKFGSGIAINGETLRTTPRDQLVEINDDFPPLLSGFCKSDLERPLADRSRIERKRTLLAKSYWDHSVIQQYHYYSI